MTQPMIAAITLNPSLDRYINVNGFEIDKVNRWASTDLYAGGKGIDVARAVHEMGGRTIAYGFMGGTTGREIEILMDEQGVPFSFTPIRGETRTNFIITDLKNHTQTRIDAPGPRIGKRELERFQDKLQRVHPAPDMVVCGGSVPPGEPVDVYYNIISLARRFGIRTILDTDSPWLGEGIKAQPFLIKPNIEEAEALLHRKLGSEAAVIAAAQEIARRGVEIVVISRGPDGLIVATDSRVIKAVPPPVKARSSVGAGDCTIAGLALKLANDEPLVEACRLAVAMGSAAVMTPGTELAHREDVEMLLPQVQVEDITGRAAGLT